jgi:transcription antitermination factor NusG
LALQWFALNCKYNKEEFVSKQLQLQGFEIYIPRILQPTANNNRPKYNLYFPGYIFVRLDLECASLSKFNRMENASGLVCIEGEPFNIPDAMMLAIRKRIKEINTGRRLLLNENNYSADLEPVDSSCDFESLFSNLTAIMSEIDDS